jgi:hypothetical protein
LRELQYGWSNPEFSFEFGADCQIDARDRGGATSRILEDSKSHAEAPDSGKCMPVNQACQVLNRFNRNKSKLFEI